MKGLVIVAIRFYQAALSPFLGGRCRFMPSCSTYAIDAVNESGVWRGALATARRLLRCRPFGGHGFDPYQPHSTAKEAS